MSELYGVQITGNAVHAWSVRRLPFEPRGWLKDYREELREGLRSLSKVDGTHLRAEYASPDRDFADVENVLLYNIGSGSYRHLSGAGLEVRRTRSNDARHHVSYELTAESTAELFTGEVLAKVSLDAPPTHREKPGSWWAAMRERLSTHVSERNTEYTVEVLIRGDASPFISAVKPLLDGLISALHVHDGSNRDHVHAAFANHGDAVHLWDLLNDPSTAVLGRRTLVRPHGGGIAWNPADDLCAGFGIMPGSAGSLLQATVYSAPH